ncbi:MAG: pyruvate dehydrogenase (acetyl-transferring) E1 component subunit alpha [Anaerolineae bacterium]|nr:pyruvate dehydrogenase (acetyl-transferring) E1 component subunit alpha [Anaerolineae bacterium]
MAVATTHKPLTKAQLLHMLRQMLLIREFEDKTAEWYARGRIAGFVHLYNGQEACAVGVVAALEPQDILMSHYRDHGHALAKGAGTKEAMAELFGKETGLVKGKGGSMHFFDYQAGHWGGYAIVGGHLPLAVGVAFAYKYKKESRIVAVVMGDGTTPNGYFHESLNFAKLWEAPVIFIVENNLYGMGTALAVHSAVVEMTDKVCAYDIPAERVDGMDVVAVYEATRRAVEHVRDGKGPYFLELSTYRFRGHSMADPQRYRDKEEVAEWTHRDPILHMRQKLMEEGLLTEKAAKKMEDDVKREIEEAVRFAEASPAPPLEALTEDIYASPVSANPEAAIISTPSA